MACDAGMRVHLERLLADVTLVDALEAVPSDASGLFVTPDGDTWRPRQGVRQRATSDWALQAEHHAASVRLRDLEAALAVAHTARAAHQAVVAATTSRRRAAERSAARAEAALGRARARLARAGIERDEAGAAAAAIAAELGELDADRARLARRRRSRRRRGVGRAGRRGRGYDGAGRCTTDRRRYRADPFRCAGGGGRGGGRRGRGRRAPTDRRAARRRAGCRPRSRRCGACCRRP